MMMTMERAKSTRDMVFSLSLEALIFTHGTRQRNREEKTFSSDEKRFAKRETAGMKS